MNAEQLQAIKERFMHTPDGYTISEGVKLIEQMEFDGIKLIVEVERLQKRLALSEKCYGIMDKCAFKLHEENKQLRAALEKVMEAEAPNMEGWETCAYKIAHLALAGDSDAI